MKIDGRGFLVWLATILLCSFVISTFCLFVGLVVGLETWDILRKRIEMGDRHE